MTHTARASGYVGSIVVNAILLYVVGHLVDWQVGWITPAWSEVVWAVNLFLEVSIAANVLSLVYDRGWFRYSALTVCSVFALQAAYWLYTVCPYLTSAPPGMMWHASCYSPWSRRLASRPSSQLSWLCSTFCGSVSPLRPEVRQPVDLCFTSGDRVRNLRGSP